MPACLPAAATPTSATSRRRPQAPRAPCGALTPPPSLPPACSPPQATPAWHCPPSWRPLRALPSPRGPPHPGPPAWQLARQRTGLPCATVPEWRIGVTRPLGRSLQEGGEQGLPRLRQLRTPQPICLPPQQPAPARPSPPLPLPPLRARTRYRPHAPPAVLGYDQCAEVASESFYAGGWNPTGVAKRVLPRGRVEMKCNMARAFVQNRRHLLTEAPQLWPFPCPSLPASQSPHNRLTKTPPYTRCV